LNIMKFLTRLTLGAALAICSAAPIAGQSPASLSRDERATFQSVQAALTAKNYAAATSAATAARAQARTPEAKYLAASFELLIGRETNNLALQASAIDAMLASGAVPAADLEELYKNQAALAMGAGRWDRAEAALTRWTEVAPGNPMALAALAEVKKDIKKLPEAVALIDRAIDMRQAAGQPVSEAWYAWGLKNACDARLAQNCIEFGQELVKAYPETTNWRDALLIFQEVSTADAATKIDALRLMRSAKALSGERDYLQLAESLSEAGFPAESKAVLDEGVAAKMVDPSKDQFKQMLAAAGKKASAGKSALAAQRTKALAASDGKAALAAADVHYSYGEYDKAAELYQAATNKGGVDVDLVNSRLGMALALAGKKAEAEAALRAVTGNRSALASFWLVWLDSRGASA
jgi:Tfp pilus assembly protein PilF